jgi:hypothetical protein
MYEVKLKHTMPLDPVSHDVVIGTAQEACEAAQVGAVVADWQLFEVEVDGVVV